MLAYPRHTSNVDMVELNNVLNVLFHRIDDEEDDRDPFLRGAYYALSLLLTRIDDAGEFVRLLDQKIDNYTNMEV